MIDPAVPGLGMGLLAQQGGSGGVMLWLGALAAVIVVGGYVLLHLRRRLLANEDESSGGMTLADLRKLHATGQLSDEEFARLKAQVIDAAKPKERHATVEALQKRKGAAGGGDTPNK